MHQIRLREPWTLVDDSVRPSPNGFSPSSHFGQIQYRRKFNAPTGISPEQGLAIEVKLASIASAEPATIAAPISGRCGLAGHVLLHLNGTLLDSGPNVTSAANGSEDASTSCRFEIASGLQPFNELRLHISVELAAQRPGPIGRLTDLLDVALLIVD